MSYNPFIPKGKSKCCGVYVEYYPVPNDSDWMCSKCLKSCELITDPSELICSFCNDTGFDKIGLKHHLENHCKIYQETPEV